MAETQKLLEEKLDEELEELAKDDIEILQKSLITENNNLKKLSFVEGGHQLEKLEFALAIAQTKGDQEKSITLRKKILELGGNVEEPGT